MDILLNPTCISQGDSGVKNLSADAGDAGDLGSNPGLGRSPGAGNHNQHTCLENPVDRGAWRATSPLGHKESDLTKGLRTHV